MRRRVMQVEAAGATGWRSDEVVTEEPLEVRVDGEPLTVTMRTPGHDLELVTGFLLSEGVVATPSEILRMRACLAAGAPGGPLNVVEVVTAGAGGAGAARRRFTTTAACGICGKQTIESVRAVARWDIHDDPLRVTAETLSALPGRLRDSQRLFERTGGLHAAAIASADGDLLCVREDVGRHNAFDKVIGWAATAGLLPLRSHVILASGRAGFELAQKAMMAGIPLLAAVSAPSSLAVDLAEEAGMTLVGFLRGDRMNVYSGFARVVQASGASAPA